MTFGFQVLTLAENRAPVTVTSVDLVDAQDLSLTGVRLAGPHRPVYQFLSVAGFPPTRYNRVSVPAIGATITPARRGWDLLVGLDVSPTGFPHLRGITVGYRIAGAGEVQRQTFPISFQACTDRSQLVDGTCSPPALNG